MSFPILSQQYDESEVEASILNLQQELADEQELAATLVNTTSEEKLADAQKFLTENSATIKAQHARLVELNLQLRKLVAENKEKAARDLAYKALLDSDEVSSTADLLAEMKAMVKDLETFLVDEGVSGRTPRVALPVAQPQPEPEPQPEENPAPAGEKTPRSGKKSGKSKHDL